MTCEKCTNLMSKEFDRYRCHICGHSIWHHFRIRPGDAGQSPNKGQVRGIRSPGFGASW